MSDFWAGLVVGFVLGLLVVWLCDRTLARHWTGRRKLMREALLSDDDSTSRMSAVRPHSKWKM